MGRRDGYRQSERGTVDAGRALYVEQTRRERCSGAARTHERIRATFTHRLRGLHDRRLWRGAHRLCRVGALGDRYRRIDHLDARAQMAELLRPGRTAARARPALPPARAPAATSDGPKSAPFASTATTMWRTSAPREPPRLSRPVMLGATRDRGRDRGCAPRAPPPHDLHTSRTRGTRGGSAWAVTARTLVQAGAPDLVIGTTQSRAAVRLLFLGDRHRRDRLAGREGNSRARTSPTWDYSSFNSLSFAQRGSGPRSWVCSGPASFRSTAQTGHSPAQSSRHST